MRVPRDGGRRACRGLRSRRRFYLRSAEAANGIWTGRKEMRWGRWHTCSLCEQDYHGVVRHASWAHGRTTLGRPEVTRARTYAMTQLGNGLVLAKHVTLRRCPCKRPS